MRRTGKMNAEKRNSFVYRVCAFFRFLRLKTHKKNRVVICKGNLCAPSSTIVNQGRLEFGAGFALLKDSTLIVRKNGTFIAGDNVIVGVRSYIVCHDRIEFGNNVSIAQDVKIYDHDHDIKTGSPDKTFWKNNFLSSPIKIGNNVWIGAGTIILRGTVIGDNSVVGAGAVLKGIYPSDSIIVQKRNDTIVSKRK